MKLKNKLLPLVGVATACAAVAPIALTSCNSSNNNGNWVDLMTKYTPSVKALDNQTATTTEANKLYFGNEKDGWKSDEDVIAQFKDDYLWWLWKDEGNGQRDYANAKAKIEYFYVNHQTYTPATGDAYKVPTFSFKVDYEGSYSYTYTEYTRTYTYDMAITVTNVPYTVWFNHNADAWFVTQDIELIADNDSSKSPIAWSVNQKLDYTYTYSEPESGYESTNKMSNEAVCYTNCYDGNIDDYAQFFRATNQQLQYQTTSLSVPVGGKSHYMFSVQNGD